MNANFGIFKCDFKGNKKDKKAYFVDHALSEIRKYKEEFFKQVVNKILICSIIYIVVSEYTNKVIMEEIL